METFDNIIDFIVRHKKTVGTIILLIIIGYFISNYMTLKSIEYEPYINLYGQKKVSSDIVFEYSKSMSYSESVSISSITGDYIKGFSNSFSNTKDVYDAITLLNDANGKSGEFIVPAGASGISYDGIRVYSWRKRYKVLFNQIDCSEIEALLAIKDMAIKGKLGVGTGILTEVSMFQLK